MNVVVMSIMAGQSRYLRHPRTYGYVPHAPGMKQDLIGGAGSDPEPEDDNVLVIICTGLVFAAVAVSMVMALT